jgi:hypothetical protein
MTNPLGGDGGTASKKSKLAPCRFHPSLNFNVLELEAQFSNPPDPASDEASSEEGKLETELLLSLYSHVTNTKDTTTLPARIAPARPKFSSSLGNDDENGSEGTEKQ